MYSLLPLNSPTHYLVIYLFSSICVTMLGLACTSIPHLCFRWNWKKTVGSRWTCFDVRVPTAQSTGLSNRELKCALKCPVAYDHNARPSQTCGQTDGRTDEHHGNRATIRSMNASRANKCFVSHDWITSCGLSVFLKRILNKRKTKISIKQRVLENHKPFNFRQQNSNLIK